jgi:carbon-monoxide dehydrogenase large subunit
LMYEASGEIVERAKAVAAHLLGAEPAQISFSEGFFQAPETNRRLDIFEIARAAATDPTLPEDLRAPLTSKKTFTGRIPAYPTGAAACEVEVDPETGALEITRYATLDDAGQPVNPLILHGQAIGGIVQGAGPALTEGVAYDSSGQVLTGSFMDYGMPKAEMFPHFDIALVEDATRGNPLRIKGGGEGGTTPATAVVMTAVHDALRPAGVAHLDMPATPERIWQAIHAARR